MSTDQGGRKRTAISDATDPLHHEIDMLRTHIARAADAMRGIDYDRAYDELVEALNRPLRRPA